MRPIFSIEISDQKVLDFAKTLTFEASERKLDAKSYTSSNTLKDLLGESRFFWGNQVSSLYIINFQLP